jgi:hypothetical protein
MPALQPGGAFTVLELYSCRIGAAMEITLNLVWALLAVASVVLWVRTENRTGSHRRLPVIALVMLIVILFPVISVSDDLWSIQNPAETDSASRRNELATSPHSIFPVIDALIEPVFTELNTGLQPSTPSQTTSKVHAISCPVRFRLQNRPPPSA